MGSQKESGTTVVNQTSTPEMTEAEKQMQKLQLGQYQQTVQPQTDVQLAGLSLVNRLLTGQIPQGGLYEQISGISPEAIGTQATRLASQNMAGYNQLGLGDSGVALAGLSRSIANELLFPAEQYNIGAKQNLLNLALTGQAQVQAPVQAGANTLAGQLAGLRSQNIQGTTTTSKTSSNPFINNFAWSRAGGLVFGGR